MRVRSWVSAMCMAMDPPKRRECIPESSGENTSLAAPNLMILARRTMVVSKELTEWIP